MIRQCAYCKVIMGESKPLSDTRVTHGICEPCMEKLLKDIDKKK